ncbi:hypothetical protein [Ideonella livida]|uniref:Uncharacterized protein n=1 Tax=Ideonella livida TaxID=2707176 RepID=A0A7C9TP70_9BURK|nr:hypothetical protein [Ideonella livida]NDY93386.1 hypothetical protein [Ideonella livida]
MDTLRPQPFVPAPVRPRRRDLRGPALVWALAVSLGLAGCAGAAPALPPTAGATATTTVIAPTTEAGGLRQALQALVGEARCQDDSACRTLGLGARPCGGPSAWLAYAERPGLAAELAPLAQALARAEQSEHERSGRMGICQVLPDPGARCEAGRCVLRGGRSAAY